jgi:hypothetical protein
MTGGSIPCVFLVVSVSECSSATVSVAGHAAQVYGFWFIIAPPTARIAS